MRSWRVGLLWLVAAAVLLPLAPQAAARLSVGAGSDVTGEAAEVDRLLAQRFDLSLAASMLLVAKGVRTDDSVGRAHIAEIARVVRADSNVARVISHLDLPDAMFVNERGTFLVVVLRPERGADAALVSLRETIRDLETRLRTSGAAVELAFTGGAAIDHDVRRASAEAAATAERRVLPLAAILLFLVFGSIVAALIPVGAGALAIALAMGAAGLIATRWPMTIILENVVTMIGLGLGIDYSLLIVTRFRSALAAGATSREAADEAARTAGRTVLISGLAVALGFAPLLLIPATELRSIAVGGLLVVVASALTARTLVPIVLARLGTRVDLGRPPAVLSAHAAERRWRRWGAWVVAHPWIAILAAGAPLLALASQAGRLSAGIPSGVWLPARMESTRGVRELMEMGHAGLIQTVRVVVRLPPGRSATDADEWRGVADLSRTFAADPRVSRVRSLPHMLGVRMPDPVMLALMPPDLRRAFVSTDQQLTLIELEPREGATPQELMHLVREIRALDPATATGMPGARLLVGGVPAGNADYEDAIGGRASGVIGFIVCGTLLALFVGFRSVLVPIKAVALNLLSVAAAMGATVLVFQDGWGVRWLGLDGPIDGLFPAVPIVVFAIVFGLSMDYEIFLVDRVAEAIRAGAAEEEALVAGIVHTGGVITSAALVMVIVFTAFAASDFLIIKILGFALSAAVVIDATLVRMMVGPALLRLAGRWNWWPGRLTPRAGSSSRS